MPPKKEKTLAVEVSLSAEVQKLEIRDGDLLVVKIKSNDMTQEVLKAIRRSFCEQIEALNKSTKVIAFVLPPPQDLDFSIVRAGEEPDAETQTALDQEEEEKAAESSTLDVGEQS